MFEPGRVFRKADGTTNASGYLRFYATDTTTKKRVDNEGGSEQTDSNGWVQLAPSGRLSTPLYGDGAYTILEYEDDQTTLISTTDDFFPRADDTFETYDIAGFFGGSPTASQLMLQFVAATAFTLPASLTNSQLYAVTDPAADWDVDIQKNGSSVGTLSIAGGANTGTFSFASETSFTAGDRLTLVAPSSVDADVADISWNLKGTLS